MVANRGFQSTGAKTRMRLIEAAHELLAEEGYPAFTARRIASKAELKPQLVHYYFRSMEDLVVTVFRKSAAIYFRLHDEALSSSRPLHALWALHCSMPEGGQINEFVALAKQYPALRDEMRQTGETFRKQQVEAIEKIYARGRVKNPQIGPAALTLLIAAVARNYAIEAQVGISLAHEELRQLIDTYLDCLEP
ncbi:hypothetical protein B2G71_16000 [Novosphingobium sp. PC22D]|uniref:TetR/AcrR family transcriptional regulator n=1 Tax=Novosphingobium sp. PC22D TaxID=1962403 RepID=UPI000BEF33A0|nr:TetR/AcrR family transcriptional regulator [Novosphingobium sp. PC22D]PEQ11626.1 hypothetical protein B2G71_16000 [Novosphingobium sp. PC22D]